jgi:AcrR family transcriptional regulator
MRTADRQEQILDRTLDVATASGLTGLTMKKIAALVGFSEAAIYRHFPTKQALLLALMGRLEARLLCPAVAIAASSDLMPTARLQRILAHHVALVTEAHSLPILLLGEASASGDPVLLARMQGIFQGYVGVLHRLMKQAAAAGEVPSRVDPGSLVMLALGVPAALAIQHRLVGNRRVERAVEKDLPPFLFDLLRTAERRDI